MIRKPILWLLSAILALFLVLAGCGKTPAPSANGSKSSSASGSSAKADTGNSSPVTINFYSVAGGDDYYKDILIPMFEQATGGKYKVNYARGKWQDIVTKIKAEGKNVNIDVVVSGVDGVPGGAKRGVWTQLYPKYKDEIHYSDLSAMGKAYIKKFDGYGVPLFVSPGGPMLAYNSDKVKNPPTTYSALKTWIEAHPKKFMYATVPTSGPGRGFYFGLIQSLGENIDKPDNLSKTWSYLKDINKYIESYPSSSGDTFKFLFDGTLDIVPHTPGWFAQMYAAGSVPPNIKTVIMSGAKQIMDAHFYVMPKNLPADRQKAALAFINFAMSPKAQSQVFAHIAIPTNTKASVDQLTSKNKKTYDTGIKGYPKEFLKNGTLNVPDGDWVLFPDVDTVNAHYKNWEDKIQALK